MGQLLSERRLKGTGRSVTVNIKESPLSWLHARGLLSERQYAAGEQLRADWERAQLGPRVTMEWEPRAPERGRRGLAAPVEPGVAALRAKARLHAASDAAGPGLSDILWRVVCAGEGMSQAESALGWPARSGRVVLGLALDRVAAFYRLP